MSVELSGNGQERRAALREPIRRPVVFAGVRGEGLLRQGVAADISASGLLIHTAQPDLVGRHLEIEIYPDDAPVAGDVIMVRGEVVWTRPHNVKGEYAMGVRFLQSFPATDVTGAGYRPATRDESADLAASIQRRLATMEPAVRVEISDKARRVSAVATPASLPVAEKDKRRSYRWLLLLLLMLGFAALISTTTIFILWRIGFYEQSLRAVGPAAEALPDIPEPATTSTSEALPSEMVTERIANILESGPSYYLNRGSLYLIQGRFPAAVQAFQTAQSRPDGTPIERFVAELGEAQALAGTGKTSDALDVLSRPWEDAAGIPEPWLMLREDFLRLLTASPTSPEARLPLVNAFAFEPTTATATEDGTPVSPAPDLGAMRIEIDTSRHLLTVLESNNIKAVYPIGLGARGKTPEGVFTIINKIENPTWYNQGNPVPAGAPENELGSRWLGLGDESGPTPLGIHATDDLASIGSNQSRGCIRMRPADVEDLFTYIQVGTPVHIRAL